MSSGRNLFELDALLRAQKLVKRMEKAAAAQPQLVQEWQNKHNRQEQDDLNRAMHDLANNVCDSKPQLSGRILRPTGFEVAQFS